VLELEAQSGDTMKERLRKKDRLKLGGSHRVKPPKAKFANDGAIGKKPKQDRTGKVS